MSIGSLKGSYSVETFEITKESQGKIVIPYEASIEEGKLFLIVKHSNETIWKEEISPSKVGNIEFKGKIGTYEISVYTDESKNVNVNISL